MRAHATQITVDPPFFALSDGVPKPLSGIECFTLLAGPHGGRLPARTAAAGRAVQLRAGRGTRPRRTGDRPL